MDMIYHMSDMSDKWWLVDDYQKTTHWLIPCRDPIKDAWCGTPTQMDVVAGETSKVVVDAPLSSRNWTKKTNAQPIYKVRLPSYKLV